MYQVLALAVLILSTLASCAWADDPSAADAGVERKTPAEWLMAVMIYSETAKRYEASHPDEATLPLGADWQDQPNEVPHFPTTYQAAYAQYQAWWTSTGQAALEQ